MMGAVDIIPASVLVIESHPIMRTALCTAIAEEPDLLAVEANIDHPQSLRVSMMGNTYYLPQNLDVVLLALGNPGLKEMEALRLLQASFPEIPVLALTSNEVAGQEQAAQAAGAQAILTKSASRSEIIHALREIHRKNSSVKSHASDFEQEVNKTTSK